MGLRGCGLWWCLVSDGAELCGGRGGEGCGRYMWLWYSFFAVVAGGGLVCGGECVVEGAWLVVHV